MRVIAGAFGGRRLRAPQGRGTRPTSDRVREALFSTLGAHVRGARVLDLYAGSGALGIEALSRGAASVVFVERNRTALSALGANLRSLGLDPPASGAVTVVAADVVSFATDDAGSSGGPFDVVFADPPYAHPMEDVLSVVVRLWSAGALPVGARIVIERDRREGRSASRFPMDLPGRNASAEPAHLVLDKERTYGDTVLLYLRVERADEAAAPEPASQGRTGADAAEDRKVNTP